MNYRGLTSLEMLIKKFSQYLERLENTASRNEMTAILADLFKNLKPEEARAAVYLALGKLAPSYTGRELQMGEKLVIRAITRAYKIDTEKVASEYKKSGDLGEAILILRNLASRQLAGSRSSIIEVYKKLIKISEISGKGSVKGKIKALADLLKALDPLSAKFIARVPLGALRLGFSDATILDALSVMSAGNKSLRKKIERAYNISADIGLIVEKFIKSGINGLEKIEITVGVPIRMAGAERLPDAQKIIEKLNACAVEPKYDGFRVQIHRKIKNEKCLSAGDLFQGKKMPVSPATRFDREARRKQGEKNFGNSQKLLQNEYEIKIYSRNLENVTAMFPDVAGATKKLTNCEIIFEGEAIGYNPDSGEFLPFQETIQRKRKHNIDLFSKNIPLQVFVYDLLYLDGKNILDMPYKKRREIMEKIFSQDEKKSEIVLTKMNIVSDAKALEKKFDEYISEGLEGVVVKKLDAKYQAGARGYHWVKLKRAMKGELADTVDCLVMGYYAGRGKRSDFGIGAILVGVYDEKTQTFKTVAKIGTGFSDEEWQEMKRRIDIVKISEKPKEYDAAKELTPDVWASPHIVIEIQADEITKSPLHLAAKDHFKDAGLALRFPRMVKWRDEKKPEQATSVNELLKLYKLQNEK